MDLSGLGFKTEPNDTGRPAYHPSTMLKLIVLGSIAIWYYSVAEPLPAIVFLDYATLVSFSDAVLKPFLLGRGVDIPMLVILIGAIGGAITYGIIGLFEGAVVLALGYKLLRAWISPDETQGELEEN